jgi:hypothetical protein
MEVKVNGNKVTITLDLQPPRPSNSGKTDVVYTTGGFVPIAGTDLRANLTIVKPRR